MTHMVQRSDRYNLRVPLMAVVLLLLSQHTIAEAFEEAFVNERDISWKVNDFNVARWKTLIGGSEGGQINDADIQFGLWQLGPRSTYHGHKHTVPEVYHILSGTANWTVGTETRQVSAGTTIYTRPGKVHKMVNLTDEPVEAIWVWWAPGGNREVFTGEYLFTEPAPEQPDGSGFKGDAGEKLY